MVEAFLYLYYLLLALVGEWCDEISPYHTATIAYYVVEHETLNVGEDVEQSEREQRDGIKQTVYGFCHSVACCFSGCRQTLRQGVLLVLDGTVVVLRDVGLHLVPWQVGRLPGFHLLYN